MSVVRWGVLGASKFARENMAPAIHAAKGADFVALATSSADKAVGFQAYAPNIAVFTDYAAMLASPDIDAVYIPLPNHMHVPWTIKALEAGKHVLCEKPIALQVSDFDALIAARDASTIRQKAAGRCRTSASTPLVRRGLYQGKSRARSRLPTCAMNMV